MLLALVPDSLWWSVCYAHTDGSKTSLELSFRTGAPTDVLPCGVGQHVFAAIDRMSGTCRLRGRPRPATGQIIRTSAGYTLRGRGIPTAQTSWRAVSPWRNGALIP